MTVFWRSIRFKFIIGFTALIVLFAGSGGLALQMTQKTHDSADAQESSVDSQEAALALKSSVGVLYSLQADLIINDNPDVIPEYKAQAQRFLTAVQAIRPIAEGQRALLEELRTRSGEYVAMFDQIEAIYRAKSGYSAVELRDAYRVADDATDEVKNRVFALCDQIIAADGEAYVEAQRLLDDSLARLRQALLIGVAVVLAVGLTLAFVLERMVTRPLGRAVAFLRRVAGGDLTERILRHSSDETGLLTRSCNEMADQLSALLRETAANAEQVGRLGGQLSTNAQTTIQASERIARVIERVAEGNAAQNTSAAESARAMEEMAAGIQRIAESSSSVAAASLEAEADAKSGRTAIDESVRQMGRIRETVAASGRIIDRVGQRSGDIQQIVDVIGTMATQTNLLALNASIEAARAGEHGKGFAVVAGEVRKLAEQSVQAAGRISEMIQGIRTDTALSVDAMQEVAREVQTGVELMEDCDGRFAGILRAIENIADQVQDLSAASEEMSAGSEQVAASLVHMAHQAQEAAQQSGAVAGETQAQLKAMEDITASTVSLAATTQGLQTAVQQFRM
ncbi:methyl-accepting chemotaxis protein [Paenibacillus athensensis]|nr:methyl-accepting chemotaxis protein [Paenibacillus athensensis]MCD1258679.1 methyl-accepting chemotaxis protein [Paenibacillus athensensis]